MTRTKPVLAVLVFVCLAALAVAGSGPAGAAAGMTKKKVQKIAAQVIAQRAPTLSVAQAATADSATTATTAGTAASAGDSAKLGGQAPGAYLTSAYTITGAQLQSTGTGSGVDITPTGIPAGRYLLTYDLAFTREGGTNVGCSVDAPGGGRQGAARSSYDVVSGSAVVTVQGAAPTVHCTSDGQFKVRLTTDTDSHVTLLRLDSAAAAGATLEVYNVV